MKNVESYPLAVLVEAFADKWKLNIYEKDEFSDDTALPCIVKEGKAWYIVFRNSLTNKPFFEKVTKKKVCHPQENLSAFRIKQLTDNRGENE